MRNILKKLNNRIGSSLVETLATVVLLGLMGIALVTGIATIQNTYNKIVRKANEQTVLSTTLIEMRNEIRKSVDYDATKGRFHSKDGYWFSFRNANKEKGEKGIRIDYYMTKDATTPTQTRPVVSEANGDVSKVYSSFGGIIPVAGSSGVFEIKNLKVGNGTDNETILSSYKVKQITSRK